MEAQQDLDREGGERGRWMKGGRRKEVTEADFHFVTQAELLFYLLNYIYFTAMILIFI